MVFSLIRRRRSLILRRRSLIRLHCSLAVLTAMIFLEVVPEEVDIRYATDAAEVPVVRGFRFLENFAYIYHCSIQSSIPEYCASKL